jgi:hypothetical protein
MFSAIVALPAPLARRACFVNLRNVGCFARSLLFAPRTKRYDRGAISDFLATMNFNVEPQN